MRKEYNIEKLNPKSNPYVNVKGDATGNGTTSPEGKNPFYSDKNMDILRQRAIDMENKKNSSYHDLIED